ncbi:hypothetical protein AXI76_gp055 [Pseudoalteromonas phage H101]|uniref:Transglycosylase SLT domain-containing protein n=1 Tax=Pseudoalteromonas phage H101 TaxID=1654919 RepID=A0A0H4ISW9_9CAUD|nr:hypothetical protein AXI76_gp055 [Pseudoalteromonas phage H101]AKO60956.1 hypothetical protein [Pseudoalteromonas phage H101]
MFRLVFVLMLVFSGVVQGSTCEEWYSLSAEQQYRLEYSYNYGKPDDLGYTLSAIALVESKAGLYKINLQTRDFGIHQINEKTLFATLGVTSYWKKNEIITRVVVDDSLSAYLAMTVLKHFDRVHKGNWKNMVMSYNIGNRKDKKTIKRGKAYYNKVVSAVKMIKLCSGFN